MEQYNKNEYDNFCQNTKDAESSERNVNCDVQKAS